ncbi:MAG: hypothetical protein ABI690_07330 [Chloroflexota bacterium]
MMWPTSIREINDLPEQEKRFIYKTLLPEWLFVNFGMDREMLTIDGQLVVQFRCPQGSRAFEISVRRTPNDIDPMLYLNMTDTFNHQLLVLLVVVNDIDTPRFKIDIDEQGNATHLGTTGRNLVAEKAAMMAGLAPGQVRKGLRSFKQAVPIFEDFVRQMGHELFLIEPLAYHNAIVFERYGFSYIRGYQEMLRIDKGFRPGGELNSKLRADRDFRNQDTWRTIRGRSWAIHDGILGHPFTGFQMYKRIGIHAGVNTFPDADW